MSTRNVYLNGDYDLAKSRGYDLVQLKYDGWFCRASAYAGQFHYHSETDREFAQSDDFKLDGCTLYGEFMRGTQWSQHPDRKGLFYVFDIGAIYGEPITNETYTARYRLLRKLSLPSVFRLVDCYPIDDYDAVWQRFVLREGFEGVVFRRTTSTLQDAIIRQKREYTLEGRVFGFEPGQPGTKYERTLGAVKLVMENGNTTTVGSGFSDSERDEIMSNQPAYLGRVCEFTANAIFESGNVRHGRFVRWRDDKS